jgi:hypothetical protein
VNIAWVLPIGAETNFPGVAGEVDAGSVVAHGSALVGVSSGDLNVSKVDAGVDTVRRTLAAVSRRIVHVW